MEPERIKHFRERLKELRLEIKEHLETSKDSSSAVKLILLLDASLEWMPCKISRWHWSLSCRENQLLRIECI